jgi:hypothetical protein
MAHILHVQLLWAESEDKGRSIIWGHFSANAERSLPSSIASTFYRGSHKRFVLHNTMSSISELDAQVLQIERQIARLTQDMRQLRTARNALVPLGRLPDEVLLHIARQSIPPHHILKGSPRNMLYLTWICQRLRVLFVGYPGLWCHIDTSACHQPGFRTFLDRSEPCPLSIRHSGTTVHTTLLALLPQTAVCHLEKMLEIPHLNSGVEFPMLHTMKVTQVAKMPSLEQATLPNLVSLEIEDVDNDDELISVLPHLPALRKFRLVGVTCSLQALHSFFSCSSLLESVNLNYVLDDDASEDINFARSSGLSQVNLPHLSHLDIEDTPECTLRLLQILPDPTISLVLDIENHDSPEQTEWDSSARKQIYFRAKDFWRRLPGAIGSLPHGCITFDGGWGMSQKLLICFDDKRLLYTQRHYSLTDEEPLLENVRALTLYFVGGARTSRPMHKFIELDSLPNLEDLLINRLQSASGFATDDILSVEQWILARSDEGHPLQHIIFRDCDEASRPFFDRLVDKQVAASISWE